MIDYRAATVAVLVLLASSAACQSAKIANPKEVRKRLGLSPSYDAVSGLANVKIAVLDFGFEGYDPAKGQLPSNTTVVEHYPDDFLERNNLPNKEFKRGFAPGNNHGRVMAQIVWATAGFSPDGPQFLLLNANGPTLLRRAIKYAIEQKVDIILLSASFEGAGNFDGKGPINAMVDEALAAGIIWVNAAGNFGKHVYDGPIQVGENGYLKFVSGVDFLRFRNNLDENVITITLNWNDYRDVEDAGTEKDLDLFVEDPNGKVVGSSQLKQISASEEYADGRTRNPRERVVLTNLAGNQTQDYRIRIKANNPTRFGSTDRLRVLITALREAPYVDPITKKDTYPVVFTDASNRSEVFPPADHPRVITIGDPGVGSSIGPTSDSRIKPDFLIEDSEAVFTNGESSVGSSNAAAYFAGITVVLKAQFPGLRGSHLLSLANRSDSNTRSTPSNKSSQKHKSSGLPGTPIAQSATRNLSVGDAVAELARLCPNLLLWKTKDNRIIAGIDRSPSTLTTLFPQFPTDKVGRLAEDYEYFIFKAKGQKGATAFGFFRRKGSNESTPWQTNGGKASDWLEVRRHLPGGGTSAQRMQTVLARRVWVTPSPADLESKLPASAKALAP